MRRITLMLAALVTVVAIGTPAAMAGGYHGGHHGGRGPAHCGYRGGPHVHHRHGHRPYYSNYRGWYGGAPAVRYVAPVYPYAYPAPGFGVATRNFSFWLGQ